MERKLLVTSIVIYAFAASAAFLFGSPDDNNVTGAVDQPNSYILQGESSEVVAEAVSLVGGEVTHELGTIDAVARQALTRTSPASLMQMTCTRRE